MSEVFIRYPPYYNILHNEDLATHAKPQNRPTAKELANTWIPVSQDSNSKRLFSILPCIAQKYCTQTEMGIHSKITYYSFGIIMSEVFIEYLPYHDILHNEDPAICICLDYRPTIKCEVPQLLLDLMNKCLDAKPQNRPTVEELANTLGQFFEPRRW
ncbi:hypothetical protein C2G38_2214603 [Gigaspora rosea]|uniref:Protein kinase domain-containing protein n=1 Tax=Gigaspora rosea TaxID=44941 RepID=A0A397UB49_9GLOM|nr:hypothetical protein C2G38_2214603 [Gigaspora rosea]